MNCLRILWTLFLITVLSINVKSQNLIINPGVDTTANLHKKAVAFYNDYISSFRENADIKKYWKLNSQYEKKTKYLIDPMAYVITKQLSIYQMADQITVMNIQMSNNIASVKSLFSWVNDKNVTVMCIVNHYIDLSGALPVFQNPEGFQPKK